MDNLDLTKILKGKEGIKLYSPLIGECKLDSIYRSGIYPIKVEDVDGNLHSFTKEGFHMIGGNMKPECLLFLSKDKRDWNDFNRQSKEEIYYYIVIYPGNIVEINSTKDNRSSFDNTNYTNGNYFINELDALNAKDKINMLFIDNKYNNLLNTEYDGIH